MSRVYSIVALVLRLALAGVFLFAAYNKLRDPLSFSESIQAFRFPLPDGLVLLGTYAIPWTEIFCGVGLALGLWSRASAFVFILMMGVFLFGIVSAIQRHLPVDCGCFGKFKLYCEGPIGWCKVVENCVMAGASMVVLVGGGGKFGLDALFGLGPEADEASPILH